MVQKNMPHNLLNIPFQRIFVINFGGIGDEILFFPVIKALRYHYEQARITTLVEPRCRSIMETNYYIDQIYTFDIKRRKHPADLIELLNLLRQESPDMIISSGSSPLVAFLLFLSGCPYRVGYATHRFQFLLTHSIDLNQDQYAASMYYDLLEAIGFQDSDPVPEIRLPSPIGKQVDHWLESQDISEPYVLIHPGVSLLSKEKQLIKSWDIEKWTALIERLLDEKHTVVLAGGPDDADELQYLEQHLSHPQLKSLYGQTKSMLELGGFIQKAGAMVCVDSAPMHLAVALGTPLVPIFGPTDEKKLLPANQAHIHPVTFDISCRPCLWATRQTTCSALSCLKEIEVEKVYNQVMKALQKEAVFS